MSKHSPAKPVTTSKWVRLALAGIAILLGTGSTAHAQTKGHRSISRSRAEVEQAAVASKETLNVRSFGATGDDRVVEATTSAGSSNVNVSDSGGFASGQYVALLKVGPAPALGAPGGVTASAMTYDGLNIVQKVGCTVDRVNRDCHTPWTFRIAAVDKGGGMSAPSPAVVVPQGPELPNPASRIKLWWNSVPEAAGYLVYGCSGSGCAPTLIATLPNNWYQNSNEMPCQGCARPTNMVFWFMGRKFGTVEDLGDRMPAGALNQILLTRISSVNGRSITLEKAPSISARTEMVHNDAPAFQSAIDRTRSLSGMNAGRNGMPIYVPPGKYPIAQSLDFYNTAEIHFFSISVEAGLPSTVLDWHGPAGGTVFDLNQAREHRFENFSVTDLPNGTTPGVVFDIDKYDIGEGIRQITTHDLFRTIGIGRAAIGFRIANRTSSNCERMTFNNISIGGMRLGWYGFYIAGGYNSLDEIIHNSTINFDQVGVYLNGAGSIDSYALNLSHNQIDWYINRIGTTYVVEQGSDSEWAAHHLYVAAASSNPMPFAIYHSRLTGKLGPVFSNGLKPDGLAANDFYIVDNSSSGLELQGNDICADSGIPCRIFFSAGGIRLPAELLSVSNRYGTNHPFVSPSGARQAIISALDHGCTNAGGGCGELAPLPMSVNPDVARAILGASRSRPPVPEE